MLLALVLYSACGLSGIRIDQRLVINGLLKRTVMVFGIGAAQLLFSVQLLSLWKGIEATSLMAANIAITALIAALTLKSRRAAGRITWAQLTTRAADELRTCRGDLLSIAVITTAIGILLTAGITGWIMVPRNDSYHFEMPRFWIQNHSLLPFPVHNPRIVSLSFLSEALQLPGYLYAHLNRSPALFTIFLASLILGLIYTLSRRTGASVRASIWAAAITVGYADFAFTTDHAGAEMFLAGLFFGTSILFLLDAYATLGSGSLQNTNLGCSIFLFFMACGAKNSTTLLLPFYVVLLAIIGKLAISAQKEQTVPTKTFCSSTVSITGKEDIVPQGSSVTLKTSLVLLSSGLAGILLSGVAWNYTSNKLWFGKSGLPPVIKTTVSQDFHPRAIWTRLCRGAVLLATDTIWIPKKANAEYVAVCKSIVRTLGGESQMVEDDTYYSFKDSAITPRKGLGLLGIGLFLPGLMMGSLRSFHELFVRKKPSPAGLAIISLSFLALAAFGMCHLVLRWQSVGMLRLMFPFVIAGAPLTALLLERRWLRATSLVLLMVSGTMFLIFWMGQVSRRMAWTDRMPFRFVASLQNNHGLTVDYHWRGQSNCEFQIQEDYTYREVYKLLLTGIHQPCTIGFVGNVNSECVFLFGGINQNRVVPMVDARDESQMLTPAMDVDYIVAADKFAETAHWAQLHGFEPLFSASNVQGEMVTAFQKSHDASRR